MGCSPSSISNKDEGVSVKISEAEEDDKQQEQESRTQSIIHQHHNPSSSKISGTTTGFKMLREENRLEDGGASDKNFIKLGCCMSMFRTKKFNVIAAFPREDSLFSGIRSGADRLKWNFISLPDLTSLAVTDHVNTSATSASVDLLLLDYRQPKLLPPETLDTIKSLKSQKIILAVVAFVKKSFFDKNDAVVLPLLEMGIDKVEIDHGITSTIFWMNELSQIEKSHVDTAHKLIGAQALLTALDHCHDMVQITDSEHRIQFVNRAYEKLLGYTFPEVSGSNFIELQNKVEQSQSSPASGIIQPGGEIQLSNHSMTGLISSTTSTNNTTSPLPLQTQMSTTQNPSLSFHDHVLDELSQGKLWEGSYMYSRKIGEPIFLNSRVFPFNYHSSTGRIPSDLSLNKVVSATHYIYICEPPTSYREKSFSSDVTSNQDTGFNPLPRGSLKSLRKASYDIKSISNDSSILRRQSLAKLHSLTIEAPITKVINIIASAQQSCPLYIAQALEKVLEILRTTELYSPQFFEGSNKVRSDDPLTTDLLGALLSQGPKASSITGRRSSNENTASRLAPRPSLPDIAEAPSRLQKLLESEAQWDFDVILLEEITEKRPLVWTGMAIFSRFCVAQSLNTDESTLRNWLTLIEANYHPSNTYHNSTHAADVLQAAAYFLSTERLKTFLEPLDEAVSLIAAAVHDVDHPGKNSTYLTNSGNDLALLYNDLSILESHHAAFTFKLTLSDARVNIFKNLDTGTYKAVRASIIDMVLATEMTKHFEHFSKFVNVFTKPFLNGKNEGEESGTSSDFASHNMTGEMTMTSGRESSPVLTPTEPDISTLITPDNIVLIKRMLIKCADVANPARPRKLCIEWAKRIAEEYFRQTDEEISRGLPPVMPMFERDTCSIPKSQTGFVDYFVVDMYEAWDAFLDVPEIIDHIKFNYEYWKELDRQGIQSAGQLDAYNKRLSQLSGEHSNLL